MNILFMAADRQGSRKALEYLISQNANILGCVLDGNGPMETICNKSNIPKVFMKIFLWLINLILYFLTCLDIELKRKY